MRAWELGCFGLLVAGCASSTSSGPRAIHSSEIAAAITRPREHPDAPLVVRDVLGHPYVLGMDEPVMAEAPPDGKERTTTTRTLAIGCGEQGRACWLERTFDVRPVPSTSSEARGGSSRGTVLGVIGAALLVGAIAGSGYCWYECKEPWDSAVPIGTGVLTLGVLAVGFAVGVSSAAAH